VIEEHAQALIALIDADNASPALVWFDGKVPTGTDPKATPYVVVYFDSNDPEADFTATPWLFQMTATCHCVGGNAQAARMVADRVRTALIGLTPTVANRSCYPITRQPGVPPQRDESTGSLVMDQVDQYVLQSIPG
jgi:hypothetical protein